MIYITNYEHIKQMSKKDLADFILSLTKDEMEIINSTVCGVHCEFNKQGKDTNYCTRMELNKDCFYDDDLACILKWLEVDNEQTKSQ